MSNFNFRKFLLELNDPILSSKSGKNMIKKMKKYFSKCVAVMIKIG
jgi:hypothetical protein